MSGAANLGLSFLFLLSVNGSGSVDSIHVSSYGAYPGDGVDDSAAIRAAINYAGANDIEVINFDAGIYDLITPVYNSYHVLLVGCDHLTLHGAVDNEGAPATRLLRHLPLANELSPPYLVYGRDCATLRVENFILDNTPQNCTAGEVVSSSGGTVVVDIFEDLPFFDGMACYSANAWDSQSGELLKVPSLTYGSSPGVWSTISGGSGRRVQISNVSFDSFVQPGDSMSWNFGVEGAAQLFFLSCSDLVLENLRVVNAVSMANLFGNIHNLTLREVVIRPEGNQLSVGPRDGFHVSRCTGDLVVDSCVVEGVRWDGFNIKSMAGEVESVLSSNRIGFTAFQHQDLNSGDSVTFWNPSGSEIRTVQGWNYTGSDSAGYHYTIDLSETLPSFVSVGSVLTPHSWLFDHVTITNSYFSKIAGGAVVFQNMHANITDCVFDNIMYSPIELGTTDSETCPAQDVAVNRCIFNNSGWETKAYGKTGLLSVGSGNDDLPGMLNREILVQSNLFMNTTEFNGIGIQLSDLSAVLVEGNEFLNVSDSIFSAASATEKISLLENTIVVDNDHNFDSYAELEGTWLDSSLTGYDGSETRFSAYTSRVRWTPDLPASGLYDVYIYKVVHSTSDQNAKITIHSEDGDSVQYLDYTAGTPGWVSLGTISFTSGTNGFVQNEYQGPGTYTRADAVKFVMAEPNDVIIDNGDTGYYEDSGVWENSALPGYLGSLSRHSPSTGASVRWQPQLSVSGQYEVCIYKVVYANSDPGAKITVHHDGGDSVQYIDYTAGTSGWVSLGTYSFAEGSSGYVKNERQSGHGRADAVWFVRKP